MIEYPWYFTVYHSILILGIITGAIRFRILSRASRYALLLIIVTLIVELMAWFLARLIHNNLIVYRPFAVIQFILIAIMYRQELVLHKYLIFIFISIVLVATLIDTVVNFSVLLKQYPTTIKSICSLLIIVIVLLYLKNLLNTQTAYSFVDYPLFWISMGWLLFSIITLFNLSAYNFIATYGGKTYLLLFERIRITTNWILYSLFIVAFLSKQRTFRE
ncbi:hypothetical protein EXU85_25760 [Spirosoma sp. KCTC 42546]|uniref:hypothetical protein n=1 Tax=Spirosoma sp. KCTC 42546 TaxID=2520506 RepID=UPI00115B2D07|nr:hypothetical protein [Spirosoma sp. KCTC 42546]QDK81831.1 hypothetical protein EXU85_25760 [Spirosoma sp. KCTC 42546]